MSDPVLKSEMIASLTLFGRPKQWRYAFDMLPSPAMSADATVTSAMVIRYSNSPPAVSSVQIYLMLVKASSPGAQKVLGINFCL
jgi:hypothetical protein